jgi:hypothetical protein
MIIVLSSLIITLIANNCQLNLMKTKTTTTLLGLLFSTALLAQETLSVKIPAIGDSIVFGSKVISSDSDIPNFGTAGIGNVWDFTSYGESPNLASSKYFAASVFDDADLFPDATIASNNRSLKDNSITGVTYAKRSNTQLDIVGTVYSAYGIIIQYDDFLTQSFPSLAFNGTFEDTYSSTGYYNNYPYFVSNDTVKYTYDAIGSLKYVYGTFPKVARISYKVKTTQETAAGYLFSNSDNKAFYDLTTGQMLFAYTNLSSLDDFTKQTSNSKNVVIYKPAQLLAIEDEQKELARLSIYPNPTQNILTFSTQNRSDFSYATIIDSKGDKITDLVIANGSQMDVSSLQNGMYFAELKLGNSTRRMKFVVAR